MDVFSSLDSLFGKRRDAASAGSGCLCGINIASLIRTVVSERGVKSLGRLLGDKQTPDPGGGDSLEIRTLTTLRALVYAARTDARLDAGEKLSIAEEIRDVGLSLPDWQRIVQFLFEDIDPEKIARNIADPGEALWIYAVSCSLVRVVSCMERGYLDQLARALRISDTEKSEVEQRSVRREKASMKEFN